MLFRIWVCSVAVSWDMAEDKGTDKNIDIHKNILIVFPLT